MKFCSALVPILAWLVLAPAAQAQDSVGVTAAIRNSVQTRNAASAPLRPAQLRAPVKLGDQFVTGQQSQLQVLLRDRSTLTVGANARMTIDRFVVSDQASVGGVTASVTRGAFRFASGRTTRGPSRQAITTPVASIGVRGTIIQGLVGAEVLELLSQQEGIPPFTGDPDTMVLVVLVGPSGETRSFDTPGGLDVEREGLVVPLDQPGEALLVTSDGVFGPFFPQDELFAALGLLLAPPPDIGAVDTGDEDVREAVAAAADDSPTFTDSTPVTAPAEAVEPVMPRDADPGFPYYPPPGPP